MGFQIAGGFLAARFFEHSRAFCNAVFGARLRGIFLFFIARFGFSGAAQIHNLGHGTKLGRAGCRRKRMQSERAGERTSAAFGVDCDNECGEAEIGARGLCFQHGPEFRLQRHARSVAGK